MKNNPLTGSGYFFRGLGLINRPGIRRFVAAPLLITVTLFALVIYFGTEYFPVFVEGLIPDNWDWARWILWPLYALAVLLLVFFAFSLVVVLAASPFNGFLAEAVERELTGRQNDTPLTWQKLLRDLASALASEIRKLAYIVLWSIPFLLLLVVPLIGQVLWFLFGAWMLAIEFFDYPMGNHGMAFPDQRRWLRERRLLGLGFGATTALALMIPFVNFLAVPAAVAGATALWVERLDGPGKAPV